MDKYKNYWYELKHSEDLIQFCFYDTEDKMKNAWHFNAEFYNLRDCVKKIEEEKSADKN